jgi:uncharacterized damage-inducible protein DinB
MKQRFIAWRYLVGLCALNLALGLVSLAQQTTNGQPAKPAQPAKEWPNDRVGGLVAEWTRAKNWSKEYLDKMPEEGYGFKPVPEIRSFAEQMNHLASANFFYVATVTGAKAPYDRAALAPEKFKTKADVTKLVLESYDFAINSLKAMDAAKLDERIVMRGTNIPRSAILTMGFEHQTHTRGQTTIYLRLKGVVPPPEPF